MIAPNTESPLAVPSVGRMLTLALRALRLRCPHCGELTYGAPLGMLLLLPIIPPFSKVVWLAVDVLLRPVTPHELHRA